MADLEIEVDVPQHAEDRWKRILDDGAEDAVDQLAVLAENHMKAEAPEGVGIPRVNMKTTIKASVRSEDPYTKVVKPHKRTQQGWPLHHVVIEGTDPTSYSGAPPPLDPILQWATAKVTPDEGSTIREVAQNIRWNIYETGHETLPNRFIDRSIRKWEGRTRQIAQDAVDDAFDTGGAI
jgi:hypothetical protein